MGVSKGRVWPVVVTTEPYQCEAGYQPPNIEVGVTLVYVTRLPQAPTHIHLRHPCTDSRGFSCRGPGEQRDLRTVHAGNPFRLSTGGQPFSNAVCVIIDKGRSGARVWDRLKGNVAPFVEMNESREKGTERKSGRERERECAIGRGECEDAWKGRREA